MHVADRTIPYLLKIAYLIRLLQDEAEISFLTQKRSVQIANKSRSPRSQTIISNDAQFLDPPYFSLLWYLYKANFFIV
jgi:hypothetical protein